MKNKRKCSVSIIGGADGPTSIFIAGKSDKRPLKVRIKNVIYKCKRKRVEKRIVAGSHTLNEVVEYAKNRYGLVEMNTDKRQYREQRDCLKASLVIQHKPELLGEMADISKPDMSNEKSLREYIHKMEERSKKAAQIPDHEIPMDYHIYERRTGDARLEVEVDYVWNIFAMSYSGNKKVMKHFQKISRDLYSYYGVNEADIRDKTQRYSKLVTALCT